MKLGTHDGPFHADEVFATAFLLKLYPDAEINRSRDHEVLRHCDIVYDVGHGKYDHHTRDKEYRSNHIPYAASGLIWRDFGRDILKQEGVNQAEVVEELFNELDELFVQPIDALDNGVTIEKSLPILDIAGVVRLINPPWDADDSVEEAFMRAVAFAQMVFNHYLNKRLAIYRAVPIVKLAYEKRNIPELLTLEQDCPWEVTLAQLDEKREVLYVISPRRNGQFTIQAVPSQPRSFSVRKRFPEGWGGLEGEELVRVTNVADAVFCHSGLWLAVSGTLNGAICLAELAIAD